MATPRPAATKPDASRPGLQPRDRIAGLENGLAVIAAFDHERQRLTITEVAALCGLSRAAARRYLLTLEALGFVSGEAGSFVLTPKVLRLSQGYMHSGRLPRTVLPALQRVAYSLKEASSAGVLEGDDVLCVAALSVGRLVSSTLQPGTRVPAYCTANGRVLLAALPPEAFDAWLARHAGADGAPSFAALTPNTITQPERLRNEIARVRAQGYATVDQELETGLRTISVPLHNKRGAVLAALNVSAHAARLSVDQLIDDCLPTLRLAQTQLKPLL